MKYRARHSKSWKQQIENKDKVLIGVCIVWSVLAIVECAVINFYKGIDVVSNAVQLLPTTQLSFESFYRVYEAYEAVVSHIGHQLSVVVVCGLILLIVSFVLILKILKHMTNEQFNSELLVLYVALLVGVGTLSFYMACIMYAVVLVIVIWAIISVCLVFSDS